MSLADFAVADLVPSGTSVLDMPRDAWREMRRNGVGASETPSLLGVGYESPLEVYLRKVGLMPDGDETDAMAAGTALEAGILDLYRRRTGAEIAARQVFVHRPEFPRAFATLDAVRADGRPVEVKLVGFHAAGDWGSEDEGLFAVPERVLWQAAHQLLASGAPELDIAALMGTDLRVWTFTRADAESARSLDLIRARVAWFLDRLDRRDPPPAVGRDDHAHLVRLHPGAVGTVQLDGLVASYAGEFLDLGAQIKDLAERRDRFKAAVLEAMKGSALAELPDGRLLARRVVTTRERTQVVKATTYAVLQEKQRKGADLGEE